MNSMQPSTQNPSILILGHTGNTGSRVAAHLKQQGIPYRGASRSSSPVFNWSRPEDWDMVLDQVQSVYVTYPQACPMDQATSRISAFIKHAKKAGVQHIVLLTGRGESQALEQEKRLQESGLAWTVIRAAWFSQNFSEGWFTDWQTSGELALPGKRAPEPFVDIEDIAEVACAALTLPGHAGQVYEVTGPDLLSFDGVSNILADVLKKTVHFSPLTQAGYRNHLKQNGVPEDQLSLADFLFETLLDGRNARLGNGVQKALGRAATPFAVFARRELTDREADAGCRMENTDRDSAKQTGNIATFKRFIAEFINGGNEAILNELIQANYLFRSPDHAVRGKDGLIHMFRGYRQAFPNLKVTTHDLMADGDKVMMDFSLQGTHQGNFMGMPPTGNNFNIRGLIISRFEAGKIAEEWEILDLATLHQQLTSEQEPAHTE